MEKKKEKQLQHTNSAMQHFRLQSRNAPLKSFTANALVPTVDQLNAHEHTLWTLDTCNIVISRQILILHIVYAA